MFSDMQLQGVIVRESKMLSGLIAKMDEFFQIRFDDCANFLAGFPYGLAPRQVLRLRKRLTNVAIC